MSRGIFVVWAPYSRRSRLLSEKLGLDLELIHYLKFQQPRYAPLKYVLQSIHTLALLLRRQPRLVFVQNPPIFAVLMVYLYRLSTLGRVQFIIDDHSGALMHPWWRWSLPLHALLSRSALATIVTNKALGERVSGWGARTMIIADVPVEFPPGKPPDLAEGFHIVVVNTFSPDEPLGVILNAAATLPDVQFYITGDTAKASHMLLESAPTNVTFTDFLPDDEYIGLLRAAQAVMVLTIDDNTLQLGACEAMALGRPLMLSDLPFLRAYFDEGTIHVPNTVAGIQAGINQMRRDWRRLEREILHLRERRRREWDELATQLQHLIEQGVNPF